ncbi:cytochrome d ubiquinol oxidase subunit II [Phytoactinopolyspora halotolerans]|uniref:Cytochrome d ubiquinol oxidase subunit II n=1 Tax=Phytoactinopolyspora halotolerans TaxID=1981512 RepID=A0A6L9S785_9ACTN|nr:cytochrome d ubiquinol oxidase subunit II [Phytoactinopolyspora halotolerans]NEE00611.1 cytochrome d ubiquinol oxidase subunit II [Phytoactinopolyspora halotolerans]
MSLPEFWFLLIAVLWTGYFVLEGFDFGVGTLLPAVAKNDQERRVAINTIGPVWDGNEVWLLTAGGATFAAFPEWYASLFSGFYLPLLVILVGLIVRGVAFEYRSKHDDARWRSRWDLCIIVGSIIPAFGWGVAFGAILHGVPLDADHEYAGSVLDLISPYSVLGGFTTLAVFAFHGATFLGLKADGAVRLRANQWSRRLGPLALGLGGSFLLWTQVEHGRDATWLTLTLAAGGLALGVVANARGREGWAFIGTAASILMTAVTLFWALFPDVLPSSIDASYSLTVDNAASGSYTLEVMSWVAVLFVPVVLLYQGWSYWVFRRRVGGPRQTSQTNSTSPAATGPSSTASESAEA